MTNEERHDEPGALRIPLAEEILEATVQERQEGVIRVTRRVETEPVGMLVDVRSDDIVIERTPRDEVVQESRQPWYEGDNLVIPVYEERLVTEKRLVLTEMIHVRRKTKTEQVEVRDTVRREVVDVESVREPEE
jgi:uncharacterized protein (TIGR02271 family)